MNRTGFENFSPVRLTMISARMRARRQCSGLVGSSRSSATIIAPDYDVTPSVFATGQIFPALELASHFRTT